MKNQNELMQQIEMLIDRGYTIQQIENILGMEIETHTFKVQVVTQIVPSNLIDTFEINMN